MGTIEQGKKLLKQGPRDSNLSGCQWCCLWSTKESIYGCPKEMCSSNPFPDTWGSVLSSLRRGTAHLDSWKCCPEGWRPFQESCYYFSDDQMPWDKSQQNCSGMDSQLVVINTKAEQDFLYKEIGRQMKYQQHSIHLYIGLRAQEVGQWRWVDQTPYNETAAFWRPGEPSDDPNELCVVISYHKDIFRNWNDVPCRIHSYRICENAAETL
uniref:C-type lectin domain-containing protein n=1 Tax=Anas platyrhynchos platyrhynchos TaxID=8840 RepID=A0A493T922_ANAPP